MVMHARKPARVSDGCNDRRDPQSYQTHKSQPKSQSGTLHRNDKVRDGSSDATPPCKMLRRADESPVSRQGDVSGHGKAKISHTPRGKNGTNGSPQENSHNSTHHNSDSHGGPGRPADRRQEPADDWTEHISSSGKKYYYNCRTEVSQWEKPKDLLEREQRQKDTAKMAANSFPRDMDYRQEALQDKATAKSTSSGDPSTAPNSSHSSSTSTSSSASQSVNSAPGGPPGSAAASSSSSSSSSAAATSSNPSTAAQAAAPAQAATAAVQSQSSALLQDPALLHQLLPALQAALQMNNGSMDVAKINEVLAAAVTQASLRSMLHKLLTAGPSAFNITALLSQAAQQSGQAAAQQPSQSPASLTSDASSPRPYGSPRNGTQQASQLSQKAQAGAGAPPSGTGTSQARGNASLGKPVLLSQVSVEKRPEDPRTLQQRSSSMEMPSPGPNHTPGAAGPPPSSSSSSSSSSGGSTGQGPASGGHCSFTPSLATHFDENLIKHVQGWPGEHAEKQAARLREDVFNMGSLYMSEICTELKNLRSLVRVCEIQATLREQRILFLRQQSKELDKLKNQNSYMA